MITHRLRNATQTHHRALEATVAIMTHVTSRTSYVRLLEQFWGFYAPMEALFVARPEWTLRGMDYAPRRKVPALRQDFAALGVAPATVAALPQCQELPSSPSFAHLLGCCYVLEGATLGGQLITRVVHEHLGLTPADGCAFFASYGSGVGPMWRAFQQWMIDEVQTDDDAQALISGAVATFQAFDRWLCASREQSHDHGSPH